MRKTAILLMLCAGLLMAGCAAGNPAGTASTVTSTASESSTTTATSAESIIPAEESSAPSSGQSSSKEDPKSSTLDKTSTQSSRPASSRAASSARPSSTPKSSSQTTPTAKSPYDRPYDIPAIEKDMEQYILSKGGKYEWRLDLDTCGWWIDPLPTNAKWQGDKLRKTLREDIDARMMHDEYEYFRVFFNPLSNGEYEVMVLCG